jgi:transcriptional regulator GlxA family with amidase domain
VKDVPLSEGEIQPGRAGGKLHLALDDFDKLVPREVLGEVAARFQGQEAERIALPPTVALDRNALTLCGLIRKTSRRARDATTCKWLRNAAAAHVIQTQAGAAGRQPCASGGPRFSQRKLQQIEDYVAATLSGEVRVEKMAEHVCMSRAQFMRRFKATTGTTPHQFVIEARIRAAKALLADAGLSLGEVATRTGFASASHFSLAFRRLVKMSPSAYRMQVFAGCAHTSNDSPPAPEPAAVAPELAEFQLEQTSLLVNREVRLLQSSKGLGWTDLFAAVTDELPHEGLRGTVPAVWLVTTNAPNDILRIGAEGEHKQILPGHAISIVGSGDTVYDELNFPLQARHVYLRQQAVDDAAREMFKDGGEQRFIRSSFGLSDPILFRLMAAIRAALDEPATGSRLKVDYLTQALAAHLLTHHSAAGAVPVLPVHAFNARQIGQLSDYVSANLSTDMSLQDLGDVVGLGRSQFVERFKATTSMTPHQYVTLRRISHARKLIARPNVDYTLIALICGFANQSHFIATFKRVTGMTPGEYRRTVV